jgi:hypothetical protein
MVASLLQSALEGRSRAVDHIITTGNMQGPKEWKSLNKKSQYTLQRMIPVTRRQECDNSIT